jgi:hypothetical protein
MERGGGFSIAASDPDADAHERALLAEWGVHRGDGGRRARARRQRLADRAVLRSQYALPSALPELRLLAAEAAAVGWGPVMLR